MKTRRARFLDAGLLSPKVYLICAGGFALFFVLCHLLGLRESTSVLAEGRVSFSAGLYLASYLLFVLVSPVLVLAAGVQTVIKRVVLGEVGGMPDPDLVTPSTLRSRVETGFREYAFQPIVLTPQQRLRGALAVQLGVMSGLHVIVYALGDLGGAERIGLILGVAATALAIRAWWSLDVWELSLLGLFGAAQASIFVRYLVAAPLPFSYRPLLVLAITLYLAVPVFLVAMRRPEPRVGSVIKLALSVVAGLVGVETLGSWLLSQRPEAVAVIAAGPDYVLRHRGPQEEHPEMGPIPVAGSVTETLYPDDPRGYFRYRDPAWALVVRPSSDARMEVTSEEVGVIIERADDPRPFQINLRYRGLALVEDTEYLVNFRVRATQERGYRYSAVMANPPGDYLGLGGTATAGREWRGVWRTFTANQTADSVSIDFRLGGDTADVYVSNLTIARSDGGRPLESRSRPEHYVSYEWNSRGCRASEYPIPPAPDAYRVLVLGDSYTAGIGVHHEDAFTSVMERLLRRGASSTDDPRRFEVVGCGAAGFSTREERLFYEERASAYQPNLVLLVLVRDDDRSLADDVRLGFVHEPAKWEHLLRTGYLLQAKRHARPNPDFSASMAELTALHERVMRDGAELAVVVFTNAEGTASDRLSASADSTARELGIPILDLRDLLATEDAATLRVHPIDDHPNETAHRIAAEAIVDWLARERLIEPPPEGQH